MGMSNDYVDGLKCGASYIRVGTLLFGNRNYENFCNFTLCIGLITINSVNSVLERNS